MSAQPQRRRFFPAKRVQTEPGQSLRLEVQLHPQGAAPAAEAQKPANPAGAQPPVWAGYFEHDGTPMTVLRADSVASEEGLVQPMPVAFVAHCPGAVQVQWQAAFHPALTATTYDWQSGTAQAVQQDFPALELPPLPPRRQAADRATRPGDPEYPRRLANLPPAQQPELHRLDDPFERPALTHDITPPGVGFTLSLSAPPWQIIPAGNTCTVICLHQSGQPPCWSGQLTLTAQADGQTLGSVALHSQHWAYV